jgi:hypothetical protein
MSRSSQRAIAGSCLCAAPGPQSSFRLPSSRSTGGCRDHRQAGRNDISRIKLREAYPAAAEQALETRRGSPGQMWSGSSRRS